NANWGGRGAPAAAKPVTVEQFGQFFPQFAGNASRFSPEPTCPIIGVPWFGAAAYCNRLSQAEGIPEEQWCYVGNEGGKFAEGMKVKANAQGLTGYRLPTQQEWEYACRADAVTSRYYGESEKLLEKYAWYQANSGDRTWPGGGKKPNDWGLFDMHGNVWVWCQDAETMEDNEQITSIKLTDRRMQCGG